MWHWILLTILVIVSSFVVSLTIQRLWTEYKYWQVRREIDRLDVEKWREDVPH